MSKKILITGGAGFVGRHFCEYFLNRGDQVFCVDNLIPEGGGRHPRLGWLNLNPLDFNNFHFYQEDCRNFFKGNKDTDFDYVFHLAARIGGRMKIEDSPLFVADDLSIDSEYWQWALLSKPKKTVCFSSSAVYPIKYQQRVDYQLLSEDMVDFKSDIGLPDNTYGWAKLTNEYLAKLAYEKHGLKSVIYRPFSGYGEDQDDNYPFPAICKRVLSQAHSRKVEIWGDGEQLRDFIHISDCVEGVSLTMDKIDNAEALNLCTGVYTSFIDFAKIAAKECGYDIEKIIGLSEKPMGVFARGGDARKLNSFGYTAKIPFAQGVRKAIDYFSHGGK